MTFIVLRNFQQFVSTHATATQVAFFIGFLGMLWVLEHRLAAQDLGKKLGHTVFNASFLLLALPVQMTMVSVMLGIAQWSTARHFGLLYLLPCHDSVLVKYGAMFLVLDFLDYAYHFGAHRIPWLWRLHLVHHTDRSLDVTTTFREHPLETLVRMLTLCLWVALCGASIQLLVLRQTFESIANIGQHSRVALPPALIRWLQYFFITPDMHQSHHHAYRPGTDCNYGDVLNLWDRLFGTLLSVPSAQIQFGVDTHLQQHEDFSALLGWKSFRRRLPT